MDTTTITLTVTNLNDSGEGSLRQALADAQSSTDQVQIVFDASLAGTISLSSSLTVPANVDVTLPHGVVMNLAGRTITVNGSLNAEYEETQEAFVSTGEYASITIKNGGELNLKNASINLSHNYTDVNVESGGSLSMEGGSLYTRYEPTIAAGGKLNLTDVEVKKCIVISTHEGISGSNNTFTGECFRLSGFSGITADLLPLISEECLDDVFIGITGNINTTTISNIADILPGGYKLVSHVTIATGETVTMEDGVTINQQGWNITVNGSLNAEYEETQEAFVSTGPSAKITVKNGGELNLKNASINLSHNYTDVNVESGGSLSMEGGSLYTYNEPTIAAGGMLSLTGVEVKKGIAISTHEGISGSNNTFTGESFRLSNFTGDTGELLPMFSDSCSEEAYIGISSLKTCTLADVSSKLGGEYKLVSHVTIAAGETVTMEDGVTINQQGWNITVNGSLNAEYEETQEAFVSTEQSSTITIKNGGELNLKNASINLSNDYTDVNVESGGSLSMEGGSLYTYYAPTIAAGGMLSLTGVEVKKCIAISTHEGISGSNNTFTGESFRLSNFTGDTGELLPMFSDACSEEAYIGISSLKTCTLADVSSKLGGEYKLVSHVTIATGETVTMEDGVTINQQGWNITVNGSLNAEYEETQEAFVSTGQSTITIKNGGELNLKNASINLSNSYTDVNVESGGSLSMQGGSLYSNSVSTVAAGGMLSLTGVEVKKCIVITTHEGISGSNNTFTGESFRLSNFTGDTGELLPMFSDACSEEAYIGISSLKTCTLADVSSKLGGEYKLVSHVTIATRETVTMEDGVTINQQGWNITVNGSLNAEYEETQEAFVSTGQSTITIKNGGELNLKNASINLSNSYTRVNVESGGHLSMEGGSLYSYYEPTIAAGGMLSLTDVEVKRSIAISTHEGISGSNNTFTGESFRLSNFTGDTGELLTMFSDNCSEEAYIGISSLKTCTLTDVSSKLAGGYKLVSNVTIATGETVTMEDGVCMNLQERSIEINGSLNAEYEEVIDAFVSTGQYAKITVKNGGELNLKNAGINLSAGYTRVNVESGGSLSMQGGSLYSYYEPTIAAGGMLSLTDVEVKKCIVIRTHEGISGSNNTFTGECFRLSGFSGVTADLLPLISEECLDDVFIGITGNINTTTISNIADILPGGYKLVSNVTVASGHTVTLEEGVSINQQSFDINVKGALKAEYAEVTDAFFSTTDGAALYVAKGGVVELQNANINFSSYGYVRVNEGGSFRMSGGFMSAPNSGISISSGGSMHLTGVEVKNTISNSGSLTLENCTVANQSVTIAQNATASIANTSGISTLTINSGAVVNLVGNDFSSTTIKLNNFVEGEVIDLSGNYWGTTDMDAIIAKIQGFDESKVLIGTILSEPNAQVFSFDASMLGAHRVSDKARSLTLVFNALVDASSVCEGCIQLIDSTGKALQVSGYEVEGNKVMVMLDSLPLGTYTVNVSANVKDVRGNAFSVPEGQRIVNFLSLELSSPKVIFFRSNSTVTDQFHYVDIFFDQEMDAASLTVDNVHVYTEDGTEVSINRVVQSGIQGNIFFRAYFDEVTAQGTYRVVVDAEVTTTDGLTMEADYVKEVYVSSPDLEVPHLVDYTDNHLGRYTTITYSVTNSGDGVAQGTWTDNIYLCKSETWDENSAVFLTSVEHKNKTVQAGESYTADARVLLDTLEPGEYYVFVKADMASRVSEVNEQNNVSYTGTNFKLTIDAQELGDTVHSFNSANEVLYVAYTATEDASICFTADDLNTRIFVSESLPNSANTVASLFLSDEASRAYFAVEAGKTYYIGLAPKKKGELQTHLDKVEFSVVGSSLSFVSPGCDCSMTLVGAEFTDGMKVRLVDEFGNVLESSALKVFDSCTAKVTFAVPEDMVLGTQYTLVVEHEGGMEAHLAEKVSVVGVSSALELEVKSTGDFRIRTINQRTLEVKNTAGYDVAAPIVLVFNTYGDDFYMYYGNEEVDKIKRSALVYFMRGGDENETLLSAGESASQRIFFKKDSTGGGYIPARVIMPTDESLVTAQEWEMLASAMRPLGVSDADWNAWWSNMQPRIGDTMGDVARFISEIQEISITASSTVPATLADVVAVMMSQCPDYVPNFAVNGIFKDADGNAMEGVMVSLYEIVDGQSQFISSTYTDNQGAYVLYGMEENGVYEIVTSCYFADAEGNEKNSLSFSCDGSDKQVALTEYREEDIVSYESGVRIASTGESLRYTSVVKGNELRLYYEVDGKKYNDLIAEGSSLENGAIYWSEKEKMLLIGWNEGDEEEKDAKFRIAKWSAEGLLYSDIIDISSPGAKDFLVDLYMNEMGNVIAVTESEDGSTVDLRFHDVDPDAENISWSTNIQSSIMANDGLSATATVSFNLPWVNWSGKFSISSEIDVAENCLSATGTLSGSASVLYTTDKKQNELKITGTLKGKDKATYDCKSRKIVEEKVSRSFSIQVSGKSEKLPSALSWLNWLKRAFSWFGLKIKIGYSATIGVTGSLKRDETSINCDCGIGIYLKTDSKKLVVGGEGKFVASLMWSSKSGMDVDFSPSASFYVTWEEVFIDKVKEKYKYHISYDKDAGWDFTKFTVEVDPGQSLVSQINEVVDVNKKVVQYENVSIGAYGTSSLTSAYVYVMDTGHLKIQYYNAQTGSYISDLTQIDIDESILLKGWSNLKTLSTDTDGTGNVFIAVEGYVLDKEEYRLAIETESEYSPAELIAKSRRIETAVISQNGDARLHDLSNLQTYSWSGSLYDVTTYTSGVEIKYVQEKIGMVWCSSVIGCNQVYFSSLEDEVWAKPSLVFSSSEVIQNCYMGEVDGSIYITFDVIQTSDDCEVVTSMVYELSDGVWTFCNTYESDNATVLHELYTNYLSDDGSNNVEPFENTGAETHNDDNNVLDEIIEGLLTTGSNDSLQGEGSGLSGLYSFLTADSFDLKQYVNGDNCPDKGCPDNPPEGQVCGKPDEARAPIDPNDIYGPAGYGEKGWIKRQEMAFQVVCENKPEENIAHAAIVTITQQIDKAFDYSTFRLGDMMIAGNYIEVESDVQSFKTRVDWTSKLGVWVDVNAWFDADTGIVTWQFEAIDPETGFVVADPFKGLLAPNFNPPEGDGGVYYYVTPKSISETGTEFSGQASIIFDFNDPIETPTLSYTLDVDAPEAAVKALAEESSTRFLRVAWDGTDKGSGIACYNVYVSVDNGNWQLWQESITAKSALYAVAEGEHTYAFFAQGVDYAGNSETLGDLVAEEAATVSTYVAQNCDLSVTALSAGREGDELTLSITFNEAASCTDWSQALQLIGVRGSVDLSAGQFKYDAATCTLTWVGSAEGLAQGEKLSVRLADGLVEDSAGVAMGSMAPTYAVAATLPSVGTSYAAPSLVDYNGDGLLDVLVGEVSNGVGKVRIYLNEGTAELASYAGFTYATMEDGKTLAVTAEGCQGAIVRMVDLTGDAQVEMLVGLADGTVRMYTATSDGLWEDAGLLTCMVGGKVSTVDVGERAAIEFTDFNGDGRTDMLVGTGDGNLVLYLDIATSGATVFDAGQYLHDSAGRIRVGSRASVAVADVDGDGLTDLLIGSSTGSILYYRNEGRAGEPLFGEGVQIISGDGVLDLSAETSRLRLSTGDLNGDGVVDIVLGRSDGSVSVLYGTQGATVLGTVQAGATPEYMIDNVKVTTHGSTLLVSWDALDAEEPGYELSYRLKGDTAATVLQVMGTSTILTLPDGVYEVSVRGLSGDVNGPWSVAQEVLIDTVAPLSPQSLAATVGEAGLVTLAWTAADGASGYMLRYKETHSATWKTMRLSGKGTETTLYDVPAGIYQWQVCAVDAAGNRSAWSDGDKFSANGAAITESTHWAAGMLFDASGQVIGGYQDVNKVGAEDSNLCWAAAASNVLAWWQQQYPTGSVLNGVPQDAAAIYACFCDNWKNVSGAESYAYTWWLANDSNSFSYNSYYNTNYQGADDIGGWYSEYYGRQNIANHTAQVQLSTLEAADVSSAWEGVYNGGGMLSLGVFNGYSNGALNGGHSLTLWGFTEDAEGYVCEVYVTDSDDDREQLLTLSVAVDEVSGLYRVAEGQGSLSGYYLGTYTYLKAGGMAVDGDAVEKATQLGMASAGDGSGRYTANSLNWVGAGDAVDYYSITAAGDGAYRVGVDTATLETAVQVSVGVLNEQGEFEAQQELLLAPGAAQGTLPGVAVEQGQTLFVKVESVGADSETNGGFYELNISGTVPSAGSGLATQNNRAEEATESAADGSSTRGWVGAGDACDFYRVEMESAGSLSLALSELENGARVRIYEQREDGTLAQLDSRAVRAAAGLDHTLALTAGSYLVEIASLDNGSGLYNTAYSLTMKKEEEEQNASGMNLA